MGTASKLLPVHCCCEPARRLGWVPVPEDYIRGLWIVFYPNPWRQFRDRGDEAADAAGLRITTMIAPLLFPDGSSTDAVKSADVPLTVWREVPGFVEDRGGA